MINIESFFAGIFATFLGISVNNLYTQRRLSNKDFKEKLEFIFNNIYDLESLYSECWGACSTYNFEKYEENKIRFFEKHRETYHIIYLYFDDIYELYHKNIPHVIDRIDEMEKTFNQKKINNDLAVKQNEYDEFIYEMQPYLLSKNLFYEIYRIIKSKINNPKKIINFERLDIDKTAPYIN